MRRRRRTQHSQQVELFNSIQQLKLKTDQSKDDLDELDKLLTFALSYPSLSSALLHHNANLLGKNDLITEQKRKEKIGRKPKKQIFQSCSCCGVLSNNEKLRYSTSLEELNLGLGPFFFYKNYVFHIVVYILLFLIYALFAIITNIKTMKEKFDVRPLCFTNSIFCFVSQMGAGAKVLNSGDENINKFSQVQAWLGVFFITIWGLLYWLKISYTQKFIIKTEEKRISASNFTLMLTHVPREYFIDYEKQKKRMQEGKKSTEQILQQLKNQSNWITKSAFQERATQLCYLSNSQMTRKFNRQFLNYGIMLGSNISYEVVKVNVAKPLYQLSQQIKKQEKKMNKKLQSKLDFFRNLVKQRQISTQFITPKQKRNQFYDDFINFYAEQFERNIEREIDYADENVVFVTLRSSSAKKQILERNTSRYLWDCLNLLKKSDFPIAGVNVHKAPEPEEIKWENVGFPYFKKQLRRISIWLVSLFLIGFSFAINIAISFINRDELNTVVSIIISIVVTVINLGIQMIIAHISYYQNQYISSTQQYSIALKIGAAQLFNSIGVPIMITLVSQHYEVIKSKRWLRNDGLVDDIFFIALFNVLIPLGSFIDPWEQFLRIKRWWYSKPINRLHMHGQKQFNKLYANYEFDIGYEYAYLTKTTIFTAFFVCMQPIIALFAPIGLTLYYLASKRNLFYHYRRPHFYESTINMAVNWILRLSLISFGLGNLTFNNFIEYYAKRPSNGTQVANWIILGIGCIWTIILPLRKHCFFAVSSIGEQDYFEKQILLNSDYDRMNPQTKQTAIFEYLFYLSKSKDLEKSETSQPEKSQQQSNGTSIVDKFKVYIHAPKVQQTGPMTILKEYELGQQRKTRATLEAEDSPTVIPFLRQSQQKVIHEKD